MTVNEVTSRQFLREFVPVEPQIYAYIRARIDSENVHETARLRLDGQ